MPNGRSTGPRWSIPSYNHASGCQDRWVHAQVLRVIATTRRTWAVVARILPGNCLLTDDYPNVESGEHSVLLIRRHDQSPAGAHILGRIAVLQNLGLLA